MRRKLLFGFLTMVFLVCGAFALAGCKEDSPSENKTALQDSMWSGTISEQVYTGEAITVDIAINGLQAGVDYEVSYTDNINAGTATVTVTGIGKYTGTLTKTFTIAKATPVFSGELSASDIVFGQTLADSKIIGGNINVEGTYQWADPSIQPSEAEKSFEYDVKFVPQDSDNYNEISVGKVSVYVKKAVVVVEEEPVASALVYGQKLSESTLSGGKANVKGSFVWAEPDRMPSAADEVETVIFQPEDKNYDAVEIQVALSVSKAVTQITTVPTAAGLVYSHRLEDSALTNGIASTAGTFAWKDGSVVPTVANEGFIVVFTPEDEANYEKAECTVSVNVEPLSVTVEATDALHEYDGEPKGMNITLVPGAGAATDTDYDKSFVVTYKNADYAESESLPSAKGEYEVKVQLNANLTAAETSFRMGIKSFITLSGQNKLYAKVDGASQSPVYDLGENFEGTVKSILVNNQSIEGHSTTGNLVTVPADGLKTIANGIYDVLMETETDVYTASVYICDVVLNNTNVFDYLTNDFSDARGKTLASDNATRMKQWYVLTCDVDMTGKDFFGIGRKSVSACTNFYGVFDGNGHVIRNWTARKDADETAMTAANVGFVGVLNTGTVRNLGLENITQERTVKDGKVGFIGGIVGALAGGTIENCYIKDVTLTISGDTNLNDTTKNSAAGAVFASTGNGTSKIINTMVLGEVNLNVVQDGMYKLLFGFTANNKARPITLKNAFIDGALQEKGYGLLNETHAFVTYENSGYKTDAELKTAATFEGYSVNYWNIEEGNVPTLKPFWTV